MHEDIPRYPEPETISPSKSRTLWKIWVGVALLCALAIAVGTQCPKSPEQARPEPTAPHTTAGPYDITTRVSFEPAPPKAPVVPAPINSDAPADLAHIQKQKLIIDVHEHIESLAVAPNMVAAMDRLGIRKTCLMGSSRFTLTLDDKVGFTGYDENNEELLAICDAYPGRFEAYVTLNPLDDDKLDKLKGYVQRGAVGLKLYVGHGYISRATGDYMFHTLAVDHPEMLEVYRYCADNHIPVLMHVNPGPKTPGFCEELVAALDQVPDMKVNVPHFMLSSIKNTRLEEFFDTFPNLRTDISFGSAFVTAGLERISRSPEKFRRLFTEYADRFMFAADLVPTKAQRKTDEWLYEQMRAYLLMLTEEEYTTPAIPNKTLRGVALPNEILEKILFKNYQDFIADKPEGTVITRQFHWARTGVEFTGREPGTFITAKADN